MSNPSCDIPGLGLRVPASQVPDPALDVPTASDRGEAVLGGGCFWCTEAVFRRLEGVTEVQPGYAGGRADTADYKQVCSGRTGHAEVIRILYDPARISYGQLLKVFFAVAHDPTQKDRQGNDVGTQYRSGIYVAGDEQRAAARASRDAFQSELDGAGFGEITTEIADAGPFYYAETYHQQYLAKNPGGYCGLGGTGVSCPIGLDLN